jgi:uncharacterized protein (DUF58 family)
MQRSRFMQAVRNSRFVGNRGSYDPKSGRPLGHQNPKFIDGAFLHKLEHLSLVLGKDLIGGLMGEHQAARRTAGIEFADYRKYSPADDIRRVDWNAYARLGTLHIKQAQAEHDTALYLLVDASPSMEFGEPPKFLAARRLAAALGYVALSHLDSVVLTAPGAAVPGGGRQKAESGQESRPAASHLPPTIFRGRAEAGSLFQSLQELRTGQAAEFDGVLAGWGSGRAGGTGRVAVIISDLLLDAYRDGVRQLVLQGFQVTVLHVLSPDELRPPEMGEFELIDSETGERLEIRLGPESLTEYGRRLHAWLEEAETWCRGHGAGYLRVQSDWDIERVLLDTLRRKRVTA